VQCRLREGFRSDSEGALIDHLRMDHQLEVDVEDLPLGKHYTDPTYEKAKQIVSRWKEDQ